MSVMADELLSLPEAYLLSAITLLGPNDAYGLAVHKKSLELAFPVNLSYGSLYPTLDRLERRKFITSRAVAPPEGKGGPDRRYFTVTGLGQRVLREFCESSGRLIAVLTPSGEGA